MLDIGSSFRGAKLLVERNKKGSWDVVLRQWTRNGLSRDKFSIVTPDHPSKTCARQSFKRVKQHSLSKQAPR